MLSTSKLVFVPDQYICGIQSSQTLVKCSSVTSISFQIILTRCGVVQPSPTRQLVSGKGGVGESAADSLKYILILELR